MAQRSFRDLDLNDLTEPLLRDLVAKGETDLVERKANIPNDGLGPTSRPWPTVAEDGSCLVLTTTASRWALLLPDEPSLRTGYGPCSERECCVSPRASVSIVGWSRCRSETTSERVA